MATKSSSTTVSPTLQKLFVAAAGLALIMQIAQSVYFTAMQYSTNPNMSGFIGYYIGLAILVAVLLALYFSKKNRALTLKNAFDVAVMASSIVFTGVGISWLTMFIPFPVDKVEGSFYYYVVAYQALPLLITIPLVVIVIRRLRAQKQW